MRSGTIYTGVAALAAATLPASLFPSPTDVDRDEDVDLADYAVFWSCWKGLDPLGQTACMEAVDFDADGDIDLRDYAVFQAAFTGRRVRASIPAKQITLDLIGIHDEASQDYNGNCLGCHGDRLNEVALDGATPTAHSQMLRAFGGADWLCIACHSQLDFLTQSASNLREQVNMEESGCTSCHGPGAAPGVPPFYVR